MGLGATIKLLMQKRNPTQRAADGWDSPRFFGGFQSFSSFPFSGSFLASRR
jgi:hypothetical protein